MRRRILWLSLAFTGLSALVAIGWGGYRDHRADELVERARARLEAPLTEAAGLDRIQASTAVSLLERAQELGREDAEVVGLLAYARALEDYQRGDLVLAESELTSAWHRLGDRASVLALRAAVARGRSQPDAARAALRAALARDPEHVHAHLLAADFALDEEAGQIALEHLDPLIARAPDVAPLHNRRGLALEILGRADALEAYERAVTLDERAHEAWINLGRLHRVAGQHRAALECFSSALRAAPTSPEATLGRGLARAANGDVAGAQLDFARAAELAPNDAEPLLALGDLLRDTSRYDEAVETYRRAIAREDADAASWLKLGNALALLEDYRGAAEAFRAALRRAPELAAALNGLGISLMHLGEREPAIRALDRAAELDAGDPNPLMNLALLHERAGDDEAARDAWTRALARDPRSAIARRRLARLRG
ncbi:MAG: tetratricopeptide repeat protein [Sandaracinaceae bacterium]|nr:tetratricopeptide repeat protein [Sandaracinaceae bacterium]